MTERVPTDDLYADLRGVADELGQAPTMNEYDELGRYSSSTIRGRVGTWSAAIESIGLEPRGPGRRPEIGAAEIVEDILRCSDGGSLSRREYDRRGRFSSNTAQRLFGTWNNAVEAAGLEPHTSPDEVLDELDPKLLRWLYYGKGMTIQDVADEVGYSKQAVLEAMDAAGVQTFKSLKARQVMYFGSVPVDAMEIDKSTRRLYGIVICDGEYVWDPDAIMG